MSAYMEIQSKTDAASHLDMAVAIICGESCASNRGVAIRKGRYGSAVGPTIPPLPERDGAWRQLCAHRRLHDDLLIALIDHLEVQRGAQGVGDLEILALPGAAGLPIDIPDADGVVVGHIGQPDAAGGDVVDELHRLARQ